MGHLKVVHPDTGGNNYHVFINNHYRGNIINFKGHWVADVGDSTDLSIDEVQAVGKIIDAGIGL